MPPGGPGKQTRFRLPHHSPPDPMSARSPWRSSSLTCHPWSPTSWHWDFGDAHAEFHAPESHAYLFRDGELHRHPDRLQYIRDQHTPEDRLHHRHSPATAFLSGWSYRKLHTISGSTSGVLTDYQVRFKVYNTTGTDTGENVYLGSNVKPDFSDLRFTTTDNTVLTYWVQETGSNYAVVWVKVPSISTTGTQIYLYYGNPSASVAQ